MEAPPTAAGELPIGQLLSTLTEYSKKNARVKWSDVSDDDETYLVAPAERGVGDGRAKVPVADAKSPGKGEEKKHPVILGARFDAPDDFLTVDPLLKGALRSLFKADQAYRTRLGLFTGFVTNTAGLFNTILNVSSIGSASEWGSIDALFDEFFVHSVTVKFMPRNVAGGGVGYSTSAAVAVPPFALNGTTANSNLANVGIIGVSLFHGAASYGSAAGMLSNPTKKIGHSAYPWTYVWRNNERFSPRAPGSAQVSGLSSQGWTLITNYSFYGGSMQFRAFGDASLGDTVHAFTLGDITEIWDVSFRARA